MHEMINFLGAFLVGLVSQHEVRHLFYHCDVSISVLKRLIRTYGGKGKPESRELMHEMIHLFCAFLVGLVSVHDVRHLLYNCDVSISVLKSFIRTHGCTNSGIKAVKKCIS